MSRQAIHHSMEEQKSHEKGKHIVLCLSSERGSKRRRREMVDMILNDDMLEEIMVRLPVKTLIICESVSKHFGVKQWRQVIPPPLDHPIDYDLSAPTFANGWLYWFSKEKTKLIAFDLHMEMFRVVPNPISKASSCVDMQIGSDDRGLLWISETNGDGMQHVWRLINHNKGGELSIMDKMFSFELNKSTCTWPDHPYYYPPLLQLTVICKKGNKVMLSKSGSPSLLLCQPLNPTSNLYRDFSCSPPPPSNTLILPYFPSLASPV